MAALRLTIAGFGPRLEIASWHPAFACATSFALAAACRMLGLVHNADSVVAPHVCLIHSFDSVTVLAVHKNEAVSKLAARMLRSLDARTGSMAALCLTIVQRLSCHRR
ncbi:unnamed protein product [Effrenium voratum]|uniref:Uncharacterized protein n=1 Tax=Effrenium voratum TaxID=2562239 RepID=A0AA36NM17_9DINO|nr:unnamed protein product [Effrenium voratum]